MVAPLGGLPGAQASCLLWGRAASLRDAGLCPPRSAGEASRPAATLSALSEMVAEGITGIKPDADL